MTRRTSIEAYHAIMDGGVVGRRQKQIYDILFNHGPLTYNQVYERLKAASDGHWVGINSSRLTEMRDIGILQEVGTTRDEFSKMTVILWDVTDQLPVEAPRKAKPDLAAQVHELRELYTSLLKEVQELKAARFDTTGQGDLFSMRGH